MKNKLYGFLKRNMLLIGALTLGYVGVFARSASAYIDPSTTTYLIQVISGVVIAIVAFVGIYWRRARKKITEKLNIDENKNKEVESDFMEIKENNKDTH